MSLLAILKTFRTLALGGPDKLVMLCLADCANEFGETSVSQTSLTEMTGLSLSGVRNALGRLARDGWISTTTAYSAEHRTPAIYQIALAKLAPAEAVVIPITANNAHQPSGAPESRVPQVIGTPGDRVPQVMSASRKHSPPAARQNRVAESAALPFEPGELLVLEPEANASSISTRNSGFNPRSDFGSGSGGTLLPPDRPAAARIRWISVDNRFDGIVDSDMDSWAKLAPAIVVVREIALAERWLQDHPMQARSKKNFAAFITNWMRKAQDIAERRGPRGGGPDGGVPVWSGGTPRTKNNAATLEAGLPALRRHLEERDRKHREERERQHLEACQRQTLEAERARSEGAFYAAGG